MPGRDSRGRFVSGGGVGRDSRGRFTGGGGRGGVAFGVEIEGLEELEARWAHVLGELDDDLARDSLDAADYGVSTMQNSHPYQDRTYGLSGGMHVVEATHPEGKREAELIVEAEYASYVNDGTTRSRPYPFMPLGEHVAEEALQSNAEASVEHACEKMNG